MRMCALEIGTVLDSLHSISSELFRCPNVYVGKGVDDKERGAKEDARRVSRKVTLSLLN